MKINQLKTMLDKETRLSYLVKEHGFNYGDNVQLNSPESIYKFMEAKYKLSYETEEHVYMLAFDTKSNLIGVFETSHGTVKSSLVSPRELFIKALLCNAVNIILIHNHPSQDSTPSREDISITKRVKESGELIGIKLLDHIIIGNHYCSLNEQGLI